MPRRRLVLIVLMAAAVISACSGHFSRKFDAVAWRDQDDQHPVRDSMVDDLLSSGRLKGLTRAQVIALLGPPTDTDKFRDWSLVYWLGPDRTLMQIDSSWLVIRIKNDRVTDAGRTED